MAFASFMVAQHTDVVYQSGNTNKSYVYQYTDLGPGGQGNTGFVTQVGNLNLSNVNQDNNGYGGSAHSADVDQLGNQNNSDVDQIQDGGLAKIYQKGLRNKAKAYQYGNKMKGYATSIGNDNQAYIYEWGSQLESKIYQSGNANYAYQKMGQGWSYRNRDSYFESTQIGHNNSSKQILQADYVHGIGGDLLDDENNYGKIVQIGNNNKAEQLMYLDPLVQNKDNYATLNQTGDRNTSYQWMKSQGNSSVVTQIGNDNYNMSQQNW